MDHVEARESARTTTPSGWRFASSRPGPPSASRRASRCSTPPRGTASRSTRPAAGTARARSAGSGSSTATFRSPTLDAPRVLATTSSPRAGASPAARRPRPTSPSTCHRSSTRPKAATVGVGRQVILRPALQKRYVELDEPTLARPAHRPRAPARRDRRPRAAGGRRRAAAPPARAARAPTSASPASSSTTCSSTSSPGTRPSVCTRSRSTSGRRPSSPRCSTSRTGTPVAVAVDAEPPAAVRRRRHLAHLRDDARPDGARAPPRARRRDAAGAGRGGLRARRGVEPADVYEVALAGNATMTQLALGIDPEPVGVAPFIMAARSYPGPARGRARARASIPRARATVFPALGAYVGGDIVAGLLATGMTRDKRLRLFIDVGTNCEIALGSAERLVCTAAPAGPAFEAAQIRCGMRAADGAIEVVRIARRRARARRDRRRASPSASAAPGSSTRSPSSSASGCSTRPAASSTAEQAAAIAPRARAPARRARPDGERVFVLHWTGRRGRRPRTPSTSPSATSASCSSPRPRSRRAGSCSSRSSGSTSRDPAGPARRLVRLATSRRRAPSGSASCRGCRSRASSRPATSRARARRWRCSRCRSAMRPTAMLEEVEYVELSDRADFNDRFIEQLAFPEDRDGPRAPSSCSPAAHSPARCSPSSRLNGWTHVDVRCLPAKLHLRRT